MEHDVADALGDDRSSIEAHMMRDEPCSRCRRSVWWLIPAREDGVVVVVVVVVDDDGTDGDVGNGCDEEFKGYVRPP